MNTKTTEAYSSVLARLQQHAALQSWIPNEVVSGFSKYNIFQFSFISDLEFALRRALTNVYRLTQLHCCLFHVLQCWKRKLKQFRLGNSMHYGEPNVYVQNLLYV